ncbi:MAG: thioredoxin domain-containing protein [Rhodoglobus sp.]
MPSTPKSAPPAEQTPAQALTNKQRRKLSKKEQAAYSVEMVEVRRREQRARRIRRRVTATIAIVAAVAVVATGTYFIVWGTVRAGEVGPANMLSDGMLLTGSTDSSTGKATLTPIATDALQGDAKPVATNLTTYKKTANLALYLDYAAPKTAKFWAANGSQIEQWLAAGYVTLEIHPVSTSTTAKNDFSKRAANALACVASTSANTFLAVSDALLTGASTTKETSMSTTDLQALVTKAGVTDPAVAGCISGDKYASWVTAATQRATHGGLLNVDKKSLASTPLVVVDKKSYSGKLTDNAALTTFISTTYEASQGGSSTASPSPTPTPTP